MLGHDLIKAGSASVVVAGGMESMTNAPHMVNARTGIRYGDGQLVDHMAWDGLTNPYDGKSMGVFAESCADKYHFSREDQDAFAIESVNRAKAAQQNGGFAGEIVPVTVSGRKGDVQVDTDEQPGRSDVAKIPTLRPAFRKENGTVTAASSSSISDGAAAVVLMSAEDAGKRGLQPLARIVAHATHSQEPEWFTTAPVGAIQKVLDKAGWKVGRCRLVGNQRSLCGGHHGRHEGLGIPHDKVNVNGGATALGHPIGCSGARLVVTLINALRTRGIAPRRGHAVHRRWRSHGDRAGVHRLNETMRSDSRAGRSSPDVCVNRFSMNARSSAIKMWRNYRESAINTRPNGIPRQRRFTMKFTRTLLAAALVALLAACSNGAQDSAQDAQKSADTAQQAADQAQQAAAAGSDHGDHPGC